MFAAKVHGFLLKWRHEVSKHCCFITGPWVLSSVCLRFAESSIRKESERVYLQYEGVETDHVIITVWNFPVSSIWRGERQRKLCYNLGHMRHWDLSEIHHYNHMFVHHTHFCSSCYNIH